MSDDYVLVVPPGMELINANERLHWSVRSRRTKALREWAGWEARRQRIPAARIMQASVVVHPGSRTPIRKFDPPNWSPTSKALIDGIVDVGVLPDDTAAHLPVVAFSAGARLALPRVSVVLALRVVA